MIFIITDANLEEAPTTIEIQDKFRTKLAEWALTSFVTKNQLRGLLKVCNESLPFTLPIDPRTVMATPRIINLLTFEDGSQYWHHGLIDQLKSVLIKNIPTKLSLNINLDGLPLHKSSTNEFWPILCNIHEMKEVQPIIIGIYCGIGEFEINNEMY